MAKRGIYVPFVRTAVRKPRVSFGAVCRGGLRKIEAGCQCVAIERNGTDRRGLRNAPEALTAYPGGAPVPFSMMQAALGALFFLVWAFIGATMLGDRMAEIRRQRATETTGRSPVPRPHLRRRAQQPGRLSSVS